MERIRTLSGDGPGPRLGVLLSERESCLARFEGDPHSRVWVCARLGGRIFSSPLARQDEWMARV